MRSVAVTEGDKVEFQRVFGYDVEGYGVGDLTTRISEFGDAEVDELCAEYDDTYDMRRSSAATVTGGGRSVTPPHRARPSSFLEEGGFVAFTDTFENLHGLKQLPASPRNGSWPTATGSAPKATGRPRPWCGR